MAAPTTRPDWNSYFFDLADKVASRSTCLRAKIGCVIVDRETHYVIATGFNGAPSGQMHCTDRGECTVFANHCMDATHSEMNALDSAWSIISRATGFLCESDRPGFLRTFDAVAYVTGNREVCSHCARSMWIAGVQEVFTRGYVGV